MLEEVRRVDGVEARVREGEVMGRVRKRTDASVVLD